MSRFSSLRLVRPAFVASAALVVSSLGAVACGGKATPAPAEPTPNVEKAEERPDPRYAALPTPTAGTKWSLPTVQNFTLKNGLRVWHLELASAPLVSVHVVIPSGASHDPAGKEGVTALSLDLLDEGAGTRSALQVSDELGRLATDYEAQTGIDYGLLSMNALAENFETSMALLADFVQKPKLDKAEFERRKSHHVAQAIARSSNPSSQLTQAFHKVLFGSGYGSAPAEGTKASLESISYADVKNRVKNLVVPEGVEIVVVGAVSSEVAQATLEKTLGAWKGKRTEKPAPLSEPATKTGAHVVDFPGAAQSSLAVVTRAGGSADPNYFTELVMNRQLGEAFTSRINMNLREAKGYTYGAFAQFRRYRRAGYYGVVANVKSDVTAASITEIFRELGDVCASRPLTAQERNDGVEGLLLGYPLRFERIDEVGLQVASLPIYGRPADFWQTWPDRVGAVSVEQANKAALPYCDPKKYEIVVVGDASLVKPTLVSLGLNMTDLPRSDGSTKTAPAPASAPSP